MKWTILLLLSSFLFTSRTLPCSAKSFVPQPRIASSSPVTTTITTTTTTAKSFGSGSGSSSSGDGASLDTILTVPRGGDRKVIAATSIGILNAIYGLPIALAADKVGMNLYKFVESPPDVTWVNSNSGTTMYPGAIALWCHYKKMSLDTTMVLTMTPLLLRGLQNLVTGKPWLLGYSSFVEIMNIVTYGAAVVTSYHQHSSASTAVTAVGVWNLIQAVLWFINPNIFGTTASPKWNNGDFMFFALRNYGNNLLALAVFFALLGQGMDMLTSLGYAWVVCGIGALIEFTITKDLKKWIPTINAVIYSWAVILIVLGALLVF